MFDHHISDCMVGAGWVGERTSLKNINEYQNKKVSCWLGLAKSGFSAAKLLHDLGALVTVNDAENPLPKSSKHRIFWR